MLARSSLTGTPSRLDPGSGYRAGPVGDPVRTQDEFLRDARQRLHDFWPQLGLHDDGSVEFRPTPHIQRTTSGRRIVHLQQLYRGVPVFEMIRDVHYDQGGRFLGIRGDNAPLGPSLDVTPGLSAEACVVVAVHALFADADAETETPVGLEAWLLELARRTHAGLENQRECVIPADVLGEPIHARLVVFHTGRDTRMGWQITITLDDDAQQYAIIVACDAAGPGEILYLQRTSNWVRAVGLVYRHNPGQETAREVGFPPERAAYPMPRFRASNTDEFPPAWGTLADTRGTRVNATSAATKSPAQASLADGVTRFAPETDDEELVINAFYLCNYLCDFFQVFGFDDDAGNFRRAADNDPGSGSDGDSGGDVLDVRIVRSGLTCLMPAPRGRGARMLLGAGTNGHTALDAEIVFHELTHAVTARLVGGQTDERPLQRPQSKGVNEALSDYFSLTVLNYHHGPDHEKTVLGDWTYGKPGGVRRHPYDAAYPGHFAQLGSHEYREEHDIGELLCAALMDMTRALTRALGSRERGYHLGWQLVLDSESLMSANPSLLDVRDNIIEALEDFFAAEHEHGLADKPEYERVNQAVWSSFARYGMGANASSAGASLAGVIADNDVPRPESPGYADIVFAPL